MRSERLVAALADALRARGLCIATAESCTGGLIAGACTELAGSSDWFDRGFVTYSNEAKAEMLGVDASLIASQGADEIRAPCDDCTILMPTREPIIGREAVYLSRAIG